MAAEKGYKDIMEYLCTKEAGIDTKDNDGVGI